MGSGRVHGARWQRHHRGVWRADEKAALCLCRLESLGQKRQYGRSVID